MKYPKSIHGLTLVEILIGIVVSTIIMTAMYGTYSAVNSSYSQVTDRAKISQSNRNVIGMIVRDIRMAGFKYYGDTIATNNQHIPILITRSTTNKCCDRIDIVYGDIKYNPAANPKTTYVRYKVTYSGGAGNSPCTYGVYKAKVRWNPASSSWDNGDSDNDDKTYERQLVVDCVEDLEFIPIDSNGKVINPAPTATNSNKSKIYNIKVVDVLITSRSIQNFFKTSKSRIIESLLADAQRKININDKYLRDTVTVSVNTRNLGLQ